MLFLPKRGNERKTSGNELSYLQQTLDLLFKKKLNIRLNTQEVYKAFEELDYSIFIKPAIGLNNKPYTYKDNNAEEIHIDIEAPLVRNLKLLIRPLPEHTNEKKKKEIKLLTIQVDNFLKLNL